MSVEFALIIDWPVEHLLMNIPLGTSILITVVLLLLMYVTSAALNPSRGRFSPEPNKASITISSLFISGKNAGDCIK